jgi:hypothetical protein
MSEIEERKSLSRVLTDLADRFPSVPPALIEEVVQDAYLEFAGAPVRDYVPVMVERISKNRISAETGLTPQARA